MGIKVSRESAIRALISQPNIKTAAIECGVSEKTLHKWLNEPEFAERLKEAQRDVTKRITKAVISRAEKAAGVLDEIMSDTESPTPARVAAAKAVIDFAIKAIEIEEIIERVETLEAMAKDN